MRNAAAKSQVIQLVLARAQTNLNVLQTVSISQLAKRHAKELIPAGKGLHLVVALITTDATLKLLQMDEAEQLRKNELVGKHGPKTEVNRGRSKGSKDQKSLKSEVVHTSANAFDGREH